MHSHCFAQYTRFNYTCPVCSKSMGDMSIYFGMLDSIVARDLAGLPSAYQMRQQVRLSTALHSHWLFPLCLCLQTLLSGACASSLQVTPTMHFCAPRSMYIPSLCCGLARTPLTYILARKA